MAAFGAEPFRARQLWHWIYHPRRRSLASRPAWQNHLRASRRALQLTEDQRRPRHRRDPQVAAAFDDGQEVETVHIPESDRGTPLASSQVGCTLNCTFAIPAHNCWCALGSAEIILRSRWRATRSAAPSQKGPDAHQHRADGHGRAALQLRQRRRGDESRWTRRLAIAPNPLSTAGVVR